MADLTKVSHEELLDIALKLNGERETLYDLLAITFRVPFITKGADEAFNLFQTLMGYLIEGSEVCDCGKGDDCGFVIMQENLTAAYVKATKSTKTNMN